MITNHALSILLVLCITACAPFPHKEDSSPTIAGKIVDAKTNKEIMDATIELHPWNENNSASVVRSDEKGNFVIKRLQRWHAVFWLLGGDPVMYGRIRITHQGYASVIREYFLSTGELFVEGGPIVKFGKIALIREDVPN